MGNVDKLQIELNGKPVIIRTLEIFDSFPLCREILLVTSPSKINIFRDLINRFQIKKVSRIIEGGKHRQDSVYNGLLEVNTEIVAVHDGARPLLTHQLLSNLYRESLEYGSCIPVLPVKDTIKIIDKNNFVQSTPNRETLFIVQTPQFFSFKVLMDSYENMLKQPLQVTDDSSIAEMAGYKVRAIPGEFENIKITTIEDIAVAETFLNRRSL
jgi:2-C-methyl-D-erythritol 4-phosphate cytidylyltransferase